EGDRCSAQFLPARCVMRRGNEGTHGLYTSRVIAHIAHRVAVRTQVGEKLSRKLTRLIVRTDDLAVRDVYTATLQRPDDVALRDLAPVDAAADVAAAGLGNAKLLDLHGVLFRRGDPCVVWDHPVAR